MLGLRRTLGGLNRGGASRRCLSAFADVPTENTAHFINGAWVECAGGTLPVTDCNSGEIFAHAPAGTAAEMESAIDAAHAAFPGWSALGLEERIAHLERFLGEYQARQGAVGAALEREMGAPHHFGKGGGLHTCRLPLHSPFLYAAPLLCQPRRCRRP